MARGKAANFSRRKRSFMTSVSGKRDAKLRRSDLPVHGRAPPPVAFLSSRFHTFFKCLFGHRHCGEHVWPSNIEGKMRERLRDLGLGQPIVHADVDVAVS